MLLATDGACKRNGTPECVAVGVAFIQTDNGDIEYLAHAEYHSTSQRGEIYGLLTGLRKAVEYLQRHDVNANEDIIWITDSEYLYNTVTKEWSLKWEANSWIGSTGELVKNIDLWEKVNVCLRELEGHLFAQWTKGHCIQYTKGKIKQAMLADPTGIELFVRINNVGGRSADKQRILELFKSERSKHGHDNPPDDVCFEWAAANATADALASYIVIEHGDDIV